MTSPVPGPRSVSADGLHLSSIPEPEPGSGVTSRAEPARPVNAQPDGRPFTAKRSPMPAYLLRPILGLNSDFASYLKAVQETRAAAGFQRHGDPGEEADHPARFAADALRLPGDAVKATFRSRSQSPLRDDSRGPLRSSRSGVPNQLAAGANSSSRSRSRPRPRTLRIGLTGKLRVVGARGGCEDSIRSMTMRTR